METTKEVTILEEPFEDSEEEWIPTGSSDDELDTDIFTSVISTSKTTRNNGNIEKLKFKCCVENCEAAYKKKWLLDDHLRKHNKERPFHCTIGECTKSFTKEPHLKRHKILVHEKSCELPCDVKGCGLVYNNKYSLKKHKNQVHNALKWPFFCKECSIGFKKKFQLNQHNYKHTGEPPFKCNICNIGFTIQRDLTKHNRNHKTYTCDCGQTFERWSGLLAHKKICSSAEKDFACKICNMRFAKKDSLTQHKIVHKETNFQCPYLNCTRNYKYKKNLTFHISFFHEKNVPEEVPCPKCEKLFSKFYLKRHLKVMHDDLPKITKPRSVRKDKGKSRTFTGATLAGLKLSQKDHKELLNNSKKNLNVRISRIDIQNIVEQSKDNELLEEAVQNKLKGIGESTKKIEVALISNIEESTEKLSNTTSLEANIKENMTILDTQINLGRNIIPAKLNNEIKTTGVSNTVQTFSDDILIACNLVLNNIEECLA